MNVIDPQVDDRSASSDDPRPRTDAPHKAASAADADEVGRQPAVLVVHNRYRHRGGEDAVFEREVDLLRAHGHRVVEFAIDNREEIPEGLSLRGRVSLARDTIWSRRSATTIAEIIRRERPDVVHVHNPFPLLSPSVYRACRRLGVPVVQTLHNYRLICPAATLFRDGHVCHDCIGRSVPWPGVLHACYRDSHTESAVVAGMLGFHSLRGTWRHDIDAYIVLTEFARDLFGDAGLPRDRMVVKTNFVEPDPGAADGPGDDFVFVGRLTIEKGPIVALDAWRHVSSDLRLTIIGDGPMRATIEERAAEMDGVDVVGQLAGPDVLAAIKRARALIMPSTWYEGNPMVVLEAFACGRPVIASRIGAMAEVIRDHETGLLFDPGDARGLAQSIEWAATHPAEMAAMGRRARSQYESLFTGQRNYEQLLAIYERVIAGVRG